MRFLFAIVALCLVAGLPFAAERSSTKTPPFGTDANPLSVKVVPPADADEKATREEEHRKEKADQDRTLTVATIVLAAVTTFLALFTGALFWATYQLVLGARSAEAPFFFAEIQGLAGFFEPLENVRANVNYAFRNGGKTPGAIRRFRDYTLFQANLPPQPDYRGSVLADRPEIYYPIGTGETGAPVFAQIPEEATAAQVVEEINAGRMSLFVIGEIEYEDIFNVTWVQGFCIRIFRQIELDRTTEPPRVRYAFMRDGGSRYNYRRRA